MSLQQLQEVAASMGLDSSLRVNHRDCPAGEDTKSRLWVTVNSNGLVTAYCHHCQGTWSQQATPQESKAVVVARLKKLNASMMNAKQATDQEKKIPLPKDMLHTGSAVPLEAKTLYNRSHLDVVTRVANNIGYSPEAGRVIIPLLDAETATYPVYVQYRKILAADNGPKYWSAKSIKKTDICALFKGGTQVGTQRVAEETTLVVTEDVFSAIHSSKHAPVVAMPLMGVSISDTQLAFILDTMPKLQQVILALDNDNLTVKAKTTKLFHKLRRFFCVDNLYLEEDIKQLKPSEVTALIKAVSLATKEVLP